MGVLRTTVAFAGLSSLAAASTFVALTRKSKVYPLPATDNIFSNAVYNRHNPKCAPVTQDICLRRVPLDEVKPELSANDGRLTEAFCAGLWSGAGYAYQRRFLEMKYRADPFTEDHLWDRTTLASSTYEVGTKITDHFEVISKTPHSIIVRSGDSPRVQEPRESDGLFEITAQVKEDENVAEFGLKSVFFNSLSGHHSPDTKPMPWHVEWLHWMYDKVLMESAIRNLTR